MKVIDISWPITEKITEYKDKNIICLEWLKTFERDRTRESKITMMSHTGTHIDSPAHFLENGKTVDQMNLLRCIGPCRILDLMHVDDAITEKDLQQCVINPGDIVLLKTKNSLLKSDDPFCYEFIYLKDSGADYLTKKDIKAVGIDYLGLERGNTSHPSHITLMVNDITVIEGLRLEHVIPGEYFFCCLPIFFIGLEAAPARAVLIEDI